MAPRLPWIPLVHRRARCAGGPVLSATLLASVLLSGCGAPPPAKRTPRVAVAISRSERRDVPYEIEATGTVEPLRTADVIAQVGGMIARVRFREGAPVREGETLFEIDPRPFDAAIAQSAAVLERDRAQATTARLDLQRAETLAEQHLIAPGELDQKRAAAQAAAASARSDSASLALAKLNRAWATVRAPISGRSGRLMVHEGDVVKSNDPASPLVTINQLHPIRVRFTVPQSEMSVLRRHPESGMRVEVLPGERDSVWLSGRLAFVDNGVDAVTGTLLLKGELDNRQDLLWPGAFVRVRLRLFDDPGALVVPSAAIANSQKGTYVYVVAPDTTVEARPVTVVRTWRDWTVLADGVKPGETVVVDGQMRLSPGARVVIRPAAGAAGGGHAGKPGAEGAGQDAGKAGTTGTPR